MTEPHPVREQLDIEAYAAPYTGRTKINRLCFIADKCAHTPTELELKALSMAYDECKKGKDTQLFEEVAEKIGGRSGLMYVLDKAWAAGVDREARLMEERLKDDLDASKKTLIDENIWTGYNDLGNFYYLHGQLDEAFESYYRQRRYCSTTKNTVKMYLDQILVSIELGMFSDVLTYVDEAEKLEDNPDIIAKLHCSAGLAYLKDRECKPAALKFLRTSHIGNSYSEVIAPRDIATYGGLCALASFDCEELESNVISNVDFHNVLNLVPKIKELIHNFYTRDNASLLECLENLKATLLLDFHLHDHVEDLYKHIRNKALIQYTLTSESIHLDIMATDFKTEVKDLEEELALLIVDDQLQARIDSFSKRLYAIRFTQGTSMFQCAGTDAGFLVRGGEILIGANTRIFGKFLGGRKLNLDSYLH